MTAKENSLHRKKLTLKQRRRQRQEWNQRVTKLLSHKEPRKHKQSTIQSSKSKGDSQRKEMKQTEIRESFEKVKTRAGRLHQISQRISGFKVDTNSKMNKMNKQKNKRLAPYMQETASFEEEVKRVRLQTLGEQRALDARYWATHDPNKLKLDRMEYLKSTVRGAEIFRMDRDQNYLARGVDHENKRYPKDMSTLLTETSTMLDDLKNRYLSTENIEK